MILAYTILFSFLAAWVLMLGDRVLFQSCTYDYSPSLQQSQESIGAISCLAGYNI
jgi:hypothetical protein